MMAGGASADPLPRRFGDIWCGDVIAAWAQLGATTVEDRAAIARALGFEYETPKAVGTTDRSAAEPQPRVSARELQGIGLGLSIAQHIARSAALGQKASPKATDSPVVIPARLELVVSPRAASERPLPAWAGVTNPLPADEVHHVSYAPPLEPLFQPGWSRAILASLCATRIADGPMDIDAVVEAICRRRPIAVMPRLPVWTLRRGIQLLLDDGESCAFYARDIADLARRLELVVGRDRTEVARFADTPAMLVQTRSDPRWRPWRPPAPGTPVVVVSDFGLTRRARLRGGATVEGWVRFAGAVNESGCPVLGILPVAPRRWPAALRRAINLLRWDRGATAGLARHVARGQLR
jgi:hypothetical protein